MKKALKGFFEKCPECDLDASTVRRLEVSSSGKIRTLDVVGYRTDHGHNQEVDEKKVMDWKLGDDHGEDA